MGFLRRSPPKPASPENATVPVGEQLRRAGADPTVPHVTRHFLYVPGVKAAQQVARKVGTAGRRVDVETTPRTGYWLVIDAQSLLVTQENLDAVRAEFEAVAREVGGEYDRWQVDIARG